MRLLTRDAQGRICFTDDLHKDIPPYAILSHTWGESKDEVSHQDIERDLEQRNQGTGASPAYCAKAGYDKIDFCMRQAELDKYEYIWIDSCCINRHNQTELTTSINSMFKWYKAAAVCYVYLTDVSHVPGDHDDWKVAFKASRWFTRGWTLQELLAPNDLRFFSQQRHLLGDKMGLAQSIHSITSIPESALLRTKALEEFPVEERFSWADERQTTIEEDQVYSLLGLFDISLIPNYAEGRERALIRLREGIANRYHDRLRNLAFTKPVQRKTSPTRQSQPVFISAQQSASRFRESLAFDYSDLRRENIATAVSGSCRWVLLHPLYQSWRKSKRNGKHNGLLWIKGTPGSGKSTIMKFIDVNLQREGDTRLITFYFNARGAELGRTVEGMYRSLIYSLLKSGENCKPILSPAVEARLRHGSKVIWPIADLQHFLQELIKQSTKKHITILIDALDECRRTELADMVQFFESLADMFEDRREKRLLIGLASRHYPVTVAGRGLEIVVEEQPEHVQDLRIYIEKRLRFDEGHSIDTITAELLQKAQGSFIWTTLAVRLLNDQHAQGLRYDLVHSLRQLPDELEDLYRTIMSSADTEQETFLLCMQLILFARDPLSFEVWRSALRSSLPCTEPRLGQVAGSSKAQRRIVTTYTRGLVEFSTPHKVNRMWQLLNPDPVLQFIHETVRDHLLGGGLKELLGTTDECVQCYSQNRLRVLCTETLQRSASTVNQGFRMYAKEHTLAHAEQAAEHVCQSTFVRELTDSSEGRLVASLVAQVSRNGPDDISRNGPDDILHLCVEGNLPRLLETALAIGHCDHARTCDERTALHCTITRNRTAMTQRLLQHGSDVQAQDRDGRTALHLACDVLTGGTFFSTGADRIFLLLEYHADPLLEDRYGRKPLFIIAGVEESDRILQQIFAQEPWKSMDFTVKDYCTMMLLSTAKGYSSPKFLLERLAVLEPDSNWSNIGLREARHSQAAEDALLQVLLKKGAEASIRDKQGCTTLHYVMLNKDANPVTVAALIEAGVDLNVHNNVGRTALDQHGLGFSGQCRLTHKSSLLWLHTFTPTGRRYLACRRLILGASASVEGIEEQSDQANICSPLIHLTRW